MQLSFDKLIELLDQQNDPQRVRAVVDLAIKRFFREKLEPAHEHRTSYLEKKKARTDFQELPRLTSAKVARLLERVEIPMGYFLTCLSGNLIAEPWDSWPPGKRLVLAIGARSATVVQSSNAIPRLMVVEHDFDACQTISRFAASLPVQCEVEPCFVPSDTSTAQANTMFQEQLERKDIGGLIVLGSIVANPMAVPAACKILQGHDPPGRSCWMLDVPGMKDDPLSENRPASEEARAGITFLGKFCKRTPEHKIAQRLKRRASKASFKDAGWVLLRQDEKLIGLIAGHGPAATAAGAIAMTKDHDIARFLELSRTSGNIISKHSPPDTVVQAFEVEGKAHWDRDRVRLDFDWPKNAFWVTDPWKP